MNRRTRTNLIVAALLAAMLALALWTKRTAESVGAPLLADPEVVRVVEVHRADGLELVFERSGDGWRMTTPAGHEVDAQRVDGIVRGLSAAPHRSYPVASVDLAPFGLDPPRATVVVDGDAYVFGIVHPVNGLRYVLHGGRLHLVDDLVMFRLAGDW